jgi:small subunit ribosomal protein S9
MAETTKKYFEAVGRRKTSVARARITPGAKNAFTVNDKSVEDYFKVAEQRAIATEAITKLKVPEKFTVTIKVNGGGTNGQAEAIRHAIARALLEHNLGLRGELKKAGYLKRDPRAKERRKFGLKKARKAPQWSKR